ncbi:MAG TPA: DUF998 domain-containing protein [Candidatus Limnocylindrales bacterium]
MTTPFVARARPAARPTDLDNTSREAAGLSFVAAGAVFLLATTLAASIAPGYDIHGGAISDLGVIAETAWLFNGSLLAIAALNLVGGWLFFREHRRAWVLAAFVLGSIGALGAGLFPLDTGGLHAIFALAAFVGFNLEALATALVVRGPIRWLSALAGVVGLVYVVVMVIGDGGNPAVFGAIGHGGAERMIAFPAMLWLLALGGGLMAGRASR